MSDRVRMRVFAVTGPGLLALLLWGLAGLPDFTVYRGPYGDILNRLAVPQRSTTDVVTAVARDRRAAALVDVAAGGVVQRDIELQREGAAKEGNIRPS